MPRWPLRQWPLLAVTLVLVGVVRAGLTLLPFRTLRALTDRIKSSAPSLRFASESDAIRAVKAASRFIPHASCLTQSLALEIILGLQGIDARTHYGVAKAPDGRLKAHAWVEAGGKPLIGVEEQFVPLASASGQVS